ncbi:hypothetical protein CALCODRAFT_510253 [Calocera cornea HHB12733]|uniref:Uncharacterized protein n=1 Tax=Calocera cornea HHB12733 TaxID=1353952 RepID=A0A165EN18_9BASI|nr:hypothetical protein CALCODRAFT_510253 [Calocera cornea HHB12733]
MSSTILSRTSRGQASYPAYDLYTTYTLPLNVSSPTRSAAADKPPEGQLNKRKRSPSPDADKGSSSWNISVIRKISYSLPQGIASISTYCNWVLMSGDGGLNAICHAPTCPPTTYTWPGEGSPLRRIKGIQWHTKAVNTSPGVLEVIASFSASEHVVGSDNSPGSYDSVHIAFQPIPHIIAIIRGSSQPIGFDGTWAAFAEHNGVKAAHLYRVDDKATLSLGLSHQDLDLGVVFAPRSSTAICFSIETELFRIHNVPPLDVHVGYIPCQLKVYVDPTAGSIFVMRRDDFIGLFTNILTEEDTEHRQIPKPWSRIAIPSDYYLGDFALIEEGRYIITILHDRRGRQPTLLQLTSLPPLPRKLLNDDNDAPDPTTVTLLKSEPGENNILLHSNCIVTIPDPVWPGIKLLLGQRHSSLWVQLSIVLPSGVLSPLEPKVLDGTVIDIVPIAEEHLMDRLSELEDRLKTSVALPYQFAKDEMLDTAEWEDWDEEDWLVGDSLAGLERELETWPNGILAGLRVCYAFSDIIHIVAFRSEGTMSEIVFYTGTGFSKRFFAFQLDYEIRSPAHHRYRLRQSNSSAAQAHQLLFQPADPKRDRSPHPDLLDQLMVMNYIYCISITVAATGVFHVLQRRAEQRTSPTRHHPYAFLGGPISPVTRTERSLDTLDQNGAVRVLDVYTGTIQDASENGTLDSHQSHGDTPEIFSPIVFLKSVAQP